MIGEYCFTLSESHDTRGMVHQAEELRFHGQNPVDQTVENDYLVSTKALCR